MIEKNELLTLIRESALAQALAQGGNERDFNAVWAQVKDQLGTRYEAEFVVMPPTPMPTTVEVTAEMEDAAQETNLTITYLPDEIGVVYVIVCAEGLFAIQYIFSGFIAHFFVIQVITLLKPLFFFLGNQAINFVFELC